MFFKHIHIRIKIVFLIIFLCFFLIIGKVFYIEVIRYDKLNTYASNLWSRNLPIWETYFKILTFETNI